MCTVHLILSLSSLFLFLPFLLALSLLFLLFSLFLPRPLFPLSSLSPPSLPLCLASGCGVNVSNSQPTVCINDVIHQHNREQGSNLRPLSTSELLARTVSAMEACVTQFQDKGHHDFCQLYYKYWLHRYRNRVCFFKVFFLLLFA